MLAAIRKHWLRAALGAWAAFTAWCVAGFPPPVDLPAHGAQLETLKNLLSGDPGVSAVYEVRFPLGYGLTYWLFLPLAFATNGAFAVRTALWVTLQLFPLSQLALLRAFRRPDWYLLLGLPLAFNLSYWYGLLPGLFAQPFVFFALAAYARGLDSPSWRWPLLLNLAAAAAMLSHLVAFVALCLGLVAFGLTRRPLFRSLRAAVLGLLAPALLCLPKAWAMAHRAVTEGPWPPTEYNLTSHFAWFFQNYRPEGVLAAAAPLAVSAVFAALYLWRCRSEPVGPAALLFALLALYFATPKTLSGIYLISVRLPVLAAVASLLLVSAEAIVRPLRVGLVLLSLASLAETAIFHARFARAVAGLEEMVREPPPWRHGYLSLAGRRVLGSKHVYLEHLGQWWTATHGGAGHNFFADAEHHPVRFRDGVALPSDLWAFPPEAADQFDALLVFGDAPLPPHLLGWKEMGRAHSWRKLVRPASMQPAPHHDAQ
ncbi:MAG: hypothetical protein HYZ28_10185 [Myxococcales bacterium]|nr:hypothetical protein [Myxococcales bacterium]